MIGHLPGDLPVAACGQNQRAPGGSLPSYSLGITTRDNDFYRFWDTLSRDRDDFTEWMREHVLDGVTAA